MAGDAAHAPGSPVPAADRHLSGRDAAALWFSLGVGLLVMQVGALLRPGLGAPQALAVIVAGSALGAGALALVAAMASRQGVSSAGLMARTLGHRLALLPVALNALQLLGWTAFELVVMRDGTVAITQQLSGAAAAAWWPGVATVVWGVALLALSRLSLMGLVRQGLRRWGLPLVLASLAWLSWQFAVRLQAQGWAGWWAAPGDGSMSLWAGLDLVIAMPVSWLPLVADFARYGRQPGATARGTWAGYALANVWCYALGLVVAACAAPEADLLQTLLLAQGGLLALGLILVDEMDNAYGDAHAGALAWRYLRPAGSVRGAGSALAVVATLLALVLPMHSLEPFLLLLSSVFVPLFVLVVLLAGREAEPAAAPAWRGGVALVWGAGVAVFHLGGLWWPELGQTWPCVAVTGLLAALMRRSHHPAG